MRHNDIHIGCSYRAKVSGKLTTVRVRDIVRPSGKTKGWRYLCTNLTTGREVVINSAQRFRVEVKAYGGRYNTADTIPPRRQRDTSPLEEVTDTLELIDFAADTPPDSLEETEYSQHEEIDTPDAVERSLPEDVEDEDRDEDNSPPENIESEVSEEENPTHSVISSKTPAVVTTPTTKAKPQPPIHCDKRMVLRMRKGKYIYHCSVCQVTVDTPPTGDDQCPRPESSTTSPKKQPSLPSTEETIQLPHHGGRTKGRGTSVVKTTSEDSTNSSVSSEGEDSSDPTPVQESVEDVDGTLSTLVSTEPVQSSVPSKQRVEKPSKLAEMLRSKVGKRPVRVEPTPKPTDTQTGEVEGRVLISSRENRGDPPHLMVMARAGTGKTTTIIGGVKKIRGELPDITPSDQQQAVWDSLEESKGARHIAVCAFNSPIAKVLQSRVPRGVDARTMHSLGLKAVTKTFGSVDIADEGNALSYAIFEDITGLDIKEVRKQDPILLGAMAELVRLCKVTLTNPDEQGMDYLVDRYDVEVDKYRDQVYELVPKILDECKNPCKRNLIDFADMIWLPVALDLPVFKYDLLLVDEFQDLGRCQHALAKKLGRRLVMVGDDRQAIYGFTGADTESMKRMRAELGEDGCIDGKVLSPSRGCVELPLTMTRRCGKAIVAEAQKIVPDFSCFPETHEGSVLQASYTTRRNVDNPYGSTMEVPYDGTYLTKTGEGDMVVCRCTAPLINQCFRLLKKGRRASVQGRKIGDDLISLINRMGAETVPDLVGKIDEWRWNEVRKEQSKKIPSTNRIMMIGDRADCITCFTEGTSTVEEVVKKVESLFTDNGKEPGVRFSTIHKAKGLEAGKVFFLQPDGATCPHPSATTDWQREQEMNLLYVGITRAIQELTFVY